MRFEKYPHLFNKTKKQMEHWTANWEIIRKKLNELELSEAIYEDNVENILVYEKEDKLHVYGYMHTDYTDPIKLRLIIGGNLYKEPQFLEDFILFIKKTTKTKWENTNCEISVITNCKFRFFRPESLIMFPDDVNYLEFTNNNLFPIDLLNRSLLRASVFYTMREDDHKKRRSRPPSIESNDDISGEEEIMRALQNGMGDNYGL